MRGSRPPGPPSMLSDSAASGNMLVYGSNKRGRGPPSATFSTEEAERTPASKRKTKVIVMLGIALPVLACIIGISAWAVTTDVLRISPRSHDNAFNRFGHQGKTRIDSMQSRSDLDVDVFLLNSVSSTQSSLPTSQQENTTTKIPGSATTLVMTTQMGSSPKASDILSKLISDMPIPKHPKNFVVFAPVADTEDNKNDRKGRRLDDKVVIQDNDDLIAEESVYSEDISQDTAEGKLPYNRKIKSSKESKIPHKSAGKHAAGMTQRQKPFNPTNSGRPPQLIKRQNKGDYYVTFPTNDKPPTKTISNRNSVPPQPKLNQNLRPNSGFPNTISANNKGFLRPDESKMSMDQTFRSPQPYPNEPMRNSNPNMKNQPFQSFPNQQDGNPFPNPAPSPQFLESQYSGPNKRMPSYQAGSLQGQSMMPPPNTANQNSQSPGFQNPSQYPQNSYSVDNTQIGSGAPQYFAPPPQTFHTKVSYDQPVNKFSPTTYEKVAQSSVDTANDGLHHHHHHHHHHEPSPSNSDPIGDVNLSDVGRNNDADRLGSIGIGFGAPRGITLQIGGGGGGLGGLLPLSALGIAKNIVSTFLPRPQLGLNSKVFLGVEVGRGGGLSIG